MSDGFLGLQSIWSVFGYTYRVNNIVSRASEDFIFEAKQKFIAQLKRNAFIFDKVFVDEQEFSTLIGYGISELEDLHDNGFLEFFTWDDLVEQEKVEIENKQYLVTSYPSSEGLAFTKFGEYIFRNMLMPYQNFLRRINKGDTERLDTFMINYDEDEHIEEELQTNFQYLCSIGLEAGLEEYFLLGEKLHDYLFTGHALLMSAKKNRNVVPIVSTVDITDTDSRMYKRFLRFHRYIENRHIDIFEKLFDFYSNTNSAESRKEAINSISHCIALPDSSVEWEQIMDYRANIESRRTFLALKHWIRKISNENLSRKELIEELEYLLAEYQHYMNVHKLKLGVGTFESISTIPLSIAESLVSQNYFKVIDKITGGIFSSRTRKIALAEAELKAPGREVAYIVNVDNKFAARGK